MVSLTNWDILNIPGMWNFSKIGLEILVWNLPLTTKRLQKPWKSLAPRPAYSLVKLKKEGRYEFACRGFRSSNHRDPWF